MPIARPILSGCPVQTKTAVSDVARLVLRIIAPAALGVGLWSCGGEDGFQQPDTTHIESIVIEGGSFDIELGYRKTLTAKVRDNRGDTMSVPVVWRSAYEAVASIDLTGRLTALDTGATTITASSLGVISQGITVRVVWLGPAKVAPYQWTSPTAATASAVVNDSIRVLVTNRSGGVVQGARVRFAVTGGGGAVSVTSATSGSNGVAATQWTLGPSIGANTVTATVVNDENQPLAHVSANPTTFAVTSYNPIAIVEGDAQTAQLLAPLPIAPAVRVVDIAGQPRVGVPVTFSPSGGGRVAASTVSTGANGVASPGAWTLGDIPGEQTLTVKVESAVLKLRAMATGTPIRYMPARVIAGGFSTCALNVDQTASCWGQEPQVGDGDTVSVHAVPTPTSGGVNFTALAGSITSVTSSIVTGHFCGIATDGSLYCWGVYPPSDTVGTPTRPPIWKTPQRVPGNFGWSQIVLGDKHACGLTADGTGYCFGQNTSGQLGNRDTLTSLTPTEVYGGFKFTQIASGSSHVCGLIAGGTALCWGGNGLGQLGDGSTVKRLSPTVVSGGLSFQSIGAGDTWSCGLSSGKAYCWGSVPGVATPQTAPRPYPTAPTFTSLTVGAVHACALTADGSAYCWGNNQFAQLGDSTQIGRLDPTPVVGGMKFKSLSAGAFHTCGQTLDQSVACWGLNTAGELGEKPSVSGPARSVPRFIILGVTP